MTHKLFIALFTLLCAACGGGGFDEISSPEGQGQLSIGITDAPVDNASAVVAE
ncbi:MAG: hypothetical protein ACI9Y1_003590 [Lentisphaeria bacterium]|jgi:hypothetical protein